MTGASELESVLRYHERTKHHFNRFAAGPRRLDWANQPDPFRRYAGAALVRLPLLAPDEEPVSPAYEDLFTPGAVRAAPLTLRSLSRLFEYSLALSAWKQAVAQEKPPSGGFSFSGRIRLRMIMESSVREQGLRGTNRW